MSEHSYVGKGNMQVMLADEHVFFEKQYIDGHAPVSTQQSIADPSYGR